MSSYGAQIISKWLYCGGKRVFRLFWAPQLSSDILSSDTCAAHYTNCLQHEDEENWPLEDKPSCKQNNKKATHIPLNNQKSYTKDDCACYYNYG